MSTSLTARRVLSVVLIALLAACARIPTSGPVIAGAGPSELPEVSVQVAPEPPRPGATPRAVVDGFFQAMANYQQGYPVARLYLASDVRDAWRPEQGATIYEDGYGVTVTTEAAVLEAPKVGRIEADGSYQHRSETLRYDLGMDRDLDGEWRIRNPPSGLLLSRYLFDKFYAPVNVYFYDPTWTTIVPDPIYLPMEDQTPTALLQALVRGPTDWLTPVVVTAVPSQTRLNVQSAFIDPTGVVEVSLNEAIAALDEGQRSRLAGQLTWTLSQLPRVTGVRMLMNGSPYAVPEAVQGVVRIGAFSSLDPIVPTRLVGTFGATPTGLVTVRGSELEPVPGPWGSTPGVTALSVSPTQDRVAAVTDDRTVLRIGRISEGAEQSEFGEGFLRPHFVRPRAPELWTMRDAPVGRAGQIAHRRVEGRTEVVALPAFEDARVLAYRLSPDATRMAAVRRTKSGRLEVGVARINRSLPDVIVDGWRAIPLGEATRPGPQVPVDVGWLDATSLLVLAADDERQPPRPYRVEEYGAKVVKIGQPDNWQAYAVVVSPRTGGGAAMVLGRNGVWRYESDYRWALVTRGLIAASYAG